jgi:hypothetical protein
MSELVRVWTKIMPFVEAPNITALLATTAHKMRR